MKTRRMVLLALAWTAGAGLEARATRAEQATIGKGVHRYVYATACPLARGDGAFRGAPVASLDGAAVWQRSLEAERVPDARLEGTLLTTTTTGAASAPSSRLKPRPSTKTLCIVWK